jgi:hypothetical protein
MAKNMETLWSNRAQSCLPINRAGRDMRESRRERRDQAAREARSWRWVSKYGVLR